MSASRRINPLRHPSTWLAFVVWGTAGFMGHPTIASFVVHFAVMPPVLFLLVFTSHWEGGRDARVKIEADTSLG